MKSLLKSRLLVAILSLFILESCLKPCTPTDSGHYNVSVISLEATDQDLLLIVKNRRGDRLVANDQLIRNDIISCGTLVIPDDIPVGNQLFSIKNTANKTYRVLIALDSGVYGKDYIYAKNYKDKGFRNNNFINDLYEIVCSKNLNSKEKALKIEELWKELKALSNYVAVEIQPQSIYNIPWKI